MSSEVNKTKYSKTVLKGFQNLCLIYESNNSLVYKSIRETDKLPVVLKVLKTKNPNQEKILHYRQDFEITHNINQRNVIRSYGLEETTTGLTLILEDFGGKSLNVWMKEWQKVGSEAFTISLFLKIVQQLILGIDQIHTHGIIHKNICLSNIVFNDSTNELKYIDFGLASYLSRETPIIKSPYVLEQSLPYLSPEQTGRMNRGVDYRTDFYSLGIVIFELLTGRLPFDATDVIEWVHCHLAKIPSAPHVLNPLVPKIVSEIVFKLIAKAPEDRYQSAKGILSDIKTIEKQFLKSGTIREFKIGKHDKVEHFLIPDKLYGRSSEIKILLDTFERTTQGSTELMLVTGFSGIGKTAVINEIQRPITKVSGYFVRGKFDQYNRSVPFFGFVQALQDLVKQLLCENETKLSKWKTKILAALGSGSRVIIDIIPELKFLIGSQPEIPELSGTAAQNRFNILIQRFIDTFAAREHPLVIFLDDLQWADLASLNLLKTLISKSQKGYLLLIGAYRDNEVSFSHPLTSLIQDIIKEKSLLRSITLKPLNLEDINQLVADTFKCSVEKTLPFSRIVYKRTKGNPFFCHQFLKSAYTGGVVTYNREIACWQYNLEQISQLPISEDIVEFMASLLQTLSEETQEVLKQSACIGNQFNLEILSAISKKDMAKVADDLWPAVEEGILIPLNKIYRTFNTKQQEVKPFGKYDPIPVYKFLHDRVQQAAYSLIPEHKKQSTHLRIGRLMIENTTNEEKEEAIFEIVNQINRGIVLLTNPGERIEIAHLNLLAGRKAKLATAFEEAWRYFTIGRNLLPENAWKHQYELTLNLYESSVEAAYLSGHFNKMDDLAKVVISESLSIHETIRIYEVKIQALSAQNKFKEAIQIGLKFLSLLKIEFPDKPSPEEIDTIIQETKSIYANKNIANLLHLPDMTHPDYLAAMRILAYIMPVSYISYPDLCLIFSAKAVSLSILFGNTPASTPSYVTYGLFLCGRTGEIDAGYQFGRLSLDLLKKFDVKELNSRVNLLFFGFIEHWVKPLRESVIPLKAAYFSGLEYGDFEFAGYSAILYCGFAYYGGINRNLTDQRREIISLSDSLLQLKQTTVYQYLQIFQQAIFYAIEGRGSLKYLKGEFYNEEKMLPVHEKANDRNGLFYLYLHKVLLSFIFNDYVLSSENIKLAKEYMDGGTGLPFPSILCFYECLTILALQRESTDKDVDKQMRIVDQNKEKLKELSQYAPMNFNYKCDLIEAEQHRVYGHRNKAVLAYKKAIDGAHKNGYIRDEAIANELLAEFYIELGDYYDAQEHMQTAYERYSSWGAHAKAKQLVKLYPELLTMQGEREGEISENTGLFTNGNSLDLYTVIKASQTIAGEIELNHLLKQMLQIAIENAGAQHGALILNHSGTWFIEAQLSSSGDITVLHSLDVNASTDVSAEIVYRVINMGESIVLEDASKSGDFKYIPSVSQRNVKSVLCTPLINQAKLSGILYLENNLISSAFTEDRLKVISLLTTQMALSLENAKLYEQAQQEIRERKQIEKALQESEDRFRTIFESVNEAILIHDPISGNILDVNHTMCKMYGYTREEALKLTVGDISIGVSPYSQKDAIEHIKNTNSSEPKIIEWHAKKKNGDLFWIEVNLRRTLISNHERILVSVRDVSERKKAEAHILKLNQELEDKVARRTAKLDLAVKELESFAYSVSHDLRAPIRHIQGFLNLMHLNINNPSKQLTGYYHKIEEATKRMSVMIDCLLEFSRLGRKKLSISNVDLNILIPEIIENYKPDTKNRNIHWVISDLPQINADKNLIKLAFENLISNALKYTSKEKKAIIAIGTEPESEDNHEIYIKDNGIGFNMDYLDKLFGVFQRLHNAVDFEGVGIGLSHVKQIIEKHGGTIIAKGEINKGATFRIFFPKS